MATSETNNFQDTQNGPTFHIQKIYVKASAFDIPGKPVAYSEWEPQTKLELEIKHQPLEEDIYDVALRLKVVAELKGKTAYSAEVVQAGILTIKNFSAEEKERVINVFAPNLLYPYLRARLSDLIISGGFPPFIAAPLDFETIYQERKKQEKAQQEKELAQPTHASKADTREVAYQ
jgi:preprotein translocase subunit SecB